MERIITDERTGIEYELIGDCYYPRLNLPEGECQPIGKWGMMHLGYLMEYRKGTYTTLLTSCKLNEYLAEINEEAARMFVSLIEEMTESEGITEQLKADNQMEWVQRMNSIRYRAAETINRLIIYA